MPVSAQFKRYASYTVGMILLAIGLTLTAQTHLGTSPLTSVAYVLAEYTHNTFSNMTLLMFTLFVLAQIALAGKPTARKNRRAFTSNTAQSCLYARDGGGSALC